MGYVCHCDICDKRIEGINVNPHVWIMGEQEQTGVIPNRPVTWLICDACFPLFEEEIKNLKKRILQWREQARG